MKTLVCALSVLATAASACSDPPALVAHSDGTLALDAPLELEFAGEIDDERLAGLVVEHDGIRETGTISHEQNIGRFRPDNGWYAGTTYNVSFEDATFSFASHGEWREIAGTSPACATDDWDPRTTATIDGAAWLVGLDHGRTCIAKWTAKDGWDPVKLVGTPPGANDTLFQPVLALADDGSGFAVHTVETRAEVIAIDGTPLAKIEGLDDFGPAPMAAMSPHGRGMIVTLRDSSSFTMRPLEVRAYDDGILAAPTTIAVGYFNLLDVAVNDAGVRAVAYFDVETGKLFLAVDRGDKQWQPHEVAKPPLNSLTEAEVAVDDEGRVFFAWLQTIGSTTEVWAISESALARTTPARIDGNTRPIRENLELASRYGHTRIAWLEKPAENQLGVAVTRAAASDGAWSPIEESTTSVHPYLDLAMAIDGMGNPAFTWKDGNLDPCGVRKIGSTWRELCGLPSPNFTAPSPGISVNARGRAFVSFFGGNGTGLATFD